MILYYDRQGNPIGDVLEWAKKFEDDDYRYLARDVRQDGSEVITVWGGIDTEWDPFEPDKPARIFHTGVFRKGRRKGRLGPIIYEQHYTTEADALAGHRRFVEGRL